MALDRQHVLERLEAAEGSRDLSGLDLTGADLSRLDLRGVDLSRADLSAADLRWAVLEGADLDAAVLRRADARWAVLRGANLRQADLVRANLGWSDLTGADLTGADLDGANLENADVEGTLLDRAPRREAVARAATTRRLAVPERWSGGRSVPEVSATTVFLTLLGVAAVVFVWGWLFQRAYFIDAFSLDAAGIAELGDPRNFTVGMSRVVWLELKTLLVIPLVFLGLVLVAAVAAVVPLLLAYLSEQVLEDIVRPEVRPFVVGGLFVAITIFFLFAIPRALAFAGGTTTNKAPGDPGLSAVFELAKTGGWLTRLGLVACLALAAYVLWILWRLASRGLSTYELPTDLRLRYPHLNSAFVNVRSGRIMAYAGELSGDERRRGLLAALGLVVLLGTVLTGTGAVFAYRDMCDGGELPRSQLYLNEIPPDVDDRTVCQRLLADNGESYYVFFPSQTVEEVAGDISSRVPNVQSVSQSEEVLLYAAVGPDDCPTCASSPDAKLASSTRFVIDPDELEVQGLVTERTADLVTLEGQAQAVSSVRLLVDTTYYALDGTTASETEVAPGRFIRATGRLAVDAPILEARVVEILPLEEQGTPTTIEVTLQDPYTIVVSGEGWTAGNEVAIGLGQAGDPAPSIPLVREPVVVGTDGTFSVPVRFREDLPTGSDLQTIARDRTTGQTAIGPWLLEPPPATATPVPTATRIVIVESSPTPSGDEVGEGTATPEPLATNTPLPTPVFGPGGPAVGDCTPDEYESDWPRGFEKEIYVGFGDGAAEAQQHNFCGIGDRYRADIDLAFFRAKAGRWYRVRTSGLAPGVDTVMAVGDLGDDTPCEPAGCWNDDMAALTFDSEIVFQAVRDAKAMITVDNRGSAYGSDASYTLSVVEFEQEPTPTPTVSPTPTLTRTPTITPTPLPLKDAFEVGNRCREAEIWHYLDLNRDYLATIYGSTDEDYYETVTLVPGMRYRLNLWPPSGQDYDLDLWLVETKSTCSLYTGLSGGLNPGEGVAEQIPDPRDGDSFSVAQEMSLVVRVFSPYPNVYYDPHSYYRLRLSSFGTPIAPSTATPAVTNTPSPTFTPTATPTEPEPEGGINPPTATGTPATPTNSPSPVPTQSPQPTASGTAPAPPVGRGNAAAGRGGGA